MYPTYPLDIAVLACVIAGLVKASLLFSEGDVTTSSLGIVGCVAFAAAYWWLFKMEYVLEFDSGITFRTTRFQKASQFPPPFPNGWFFICLSSEVANGQVREVLALGKAMVLFRTNPDPSDDAHRQPTVYTKGKGRLGMLDAFCPHMGANLGVAGEISKSSNCLKCCFHGWEFDHDGNCVKVHGTDSIPSHSSIKRYHIRENNGSIYLWHDAEDREPQYDPPAFPAIDDGSMYFGGVTGLKVHAHIQELPENGADVAHLNVLHKDLVNDTLGCLGLHHSWSATWAPDEARPYRTNITVNQSVCFKERYTLPGLSVSVDIHQHGPALVSLDYKTPFGRLVLFENVTPEKVTTLQVRHVLFCANTIPRPIAKFVLWATQAQFNRDVKIWETKRFVTKPLVSKADGPLMAFRRWYSQFYTAGSTSFADALAQETMIDW